jgi:hypothetical protein
MLSVCANFILFTLCVHAFGGFPSFEGKLREIILLDLFLGYPIGLSKSAKKVNTWIRDVSSRFLKSESRKVKRERVRCRISIFFSIFILRFRSRNDAKLTISKSGGISVLRIDENAKRSRVNAVIVSIARSADTHVFVTHER